MSTWADQREKAPKAGSSKEEQAKAIEEAKRFNGLLKQFANDKYLQEFLKNPTVQAAIMHWTGAARLGPEIAKQFERNPNVMYVFQKMQMIGHEANKNPVANRALMECMTSGASELRPDHVFYLYGEEVALTLYGDVLKKAAALKATGEKKKKENATANISAAKAISESVKEEVRVQGKTVLEQFTGSSSDSAAATTTTAMIDDNVKNPYPTAATVGAASSSNSDINRHAAEPPLKGMGRVWEVLAAVWSFGHEDPSGANFTLVKWFLRIIIDVLVYGAIGYWLALQFEKYIPEPEAVFGGGSNSSSDTGGVASVGEAAADLISAGVADAVRPAMDENFEF